MRFLAALGMVGLVGLLPLTAAGQGTVSFYAAPGGSDSNPGTLEAPFASLAKLCQSLSAGQTGEMLGGLYTGQSVTSCAWGTGGKPITITNYPGATPVISAGALMAGRSGPGCPGVYSSLSNCYYATVPSGLPKFEALWYNGVRRSRARNAPCTALSGNCVPGGNDDYLVMTGGSYSTADACNSAPAATMTFYTGDVRNSYYNENDVEIIDFMTFLVQRERICSIRGNTINFTGTLIDYTPGPFASGRKYLIENSREDFLANNAPGTWHLD